MTNMETTISATQPHMDGNDLRMTAPTRQLCDDVRDRIHQFEGQARKEVVEIGALLIQIKNELAHGAFKKWLDAEVRWSIRTAENYMNVAKNIGDKYETVSHLPLKTVYELAGPSVTDQVRKKVLAKIVDPANPPTAEIKKLLGEAQGHAKAVANRGNIKSAKARGTTLLRNEKAAQKAETLNTDGRVVKDGLVVLAKSWLFRISELAPEICAKIKEHGAYDIGVAIGAAAESIKTNHRATKT